MSVTQSDSIETKLHKLYLRLLGRGCDSSGLKTYGDLLKKSASIEDIEAIIRQSAEFLQRQAIGDTNDTDAEVSDDCGSGPRRLRIEEDSQLVENPDLRALIDLPEVTLNPDSSQFDPDCLNIHWVIPDFSPGSGGHMTIFRLVRLLEIKGHENTIWIHNTGHHGFVEDAFNTLVKHYTQVTAQVYRFDDCNPKLWGDIIFATDWASVSYVCSAEKFKRRFYFVQDYEPYFYPKGSLSVAAANTYRQDLDCICAGPWLAEKMRRHGRWVWDFKLAVDESVYRPGNRSQDKTVFRIAFYCRQCSPRRAVELGFLAFEQLSRQGIEFELHCFSEKQKFESAPFPIVDHAQLSAPELARLYQNCDLGIVFSTTNYSLVPQEMMACGLPVAEISSECTRSIFPGDVITLLDSHPRQMAEQIGELILNPERLCEQADAADKWIRGQNWERVSEQIEDCLSSRLTSKGFVKKKRTVVDSPPVKASVCIPTLNGGQLLKEVITKLINQVAPWPFEILVIDSGSGDGTVEFLEQIPQIRLYQIRQAEFQHGKTRNMAAEMARGEYVAFLTQDALPTDGFWLYNLVSCLEHFPNAAGAFGRHIAHAGADRFTCRDLLAHFKMFHDLPISVSKTLDHEKWASKDRAWQQILHFYSNNNSCLRRAVWERFPYPELEFGEDQAWAWKIIEAGYEKLYACHATVAHSHNYSVKETEARAFVEATFFYHEFGYVLAEAWREPNALSILNSADRAYGELYGEDERVIQTHCCPANE